MLVLVLFLVPLYHSTKIPIDGIQQHSPDSQPSPSSSTCDTSMCRVSDQSLNSALATYLCYPNEKSRGMDEIDKKRALADKIAPYLEETEVEDLLNMGSESLIGLVNLVLHGGDTTLVKKTKKDHLSELINTITSSKRNQQTSEFYQDVNPILLGMINCQSQAIEKVLDLLGPKMKTEENREGRGSFLTEFINSIMGTTSTTGTTINCTCGKTKTSTKIVGGTESEVNQYPWIALLNMDGGQCGGSLIADKWILTAAHCFYDPNTGTLRVTDPSKITITLGEHDQSITTESTLTKAITPDLQKLHDGYVFSTNVNDIALLRLPAAEDLNVYTPVCLPPTGADYVGKTAVVYGWGTTFFGNLATSDVLLDVEVLVVSDDSAKTNLGVDDEQAAVMLFAGGVVTDKDSCQGDSGGPLSYDESGKHIQIGVVSWGNECGLLNNPGAYADVSVFRTWIGQQIAANDGGAFCTA